MTIRVAVLPARYYAGPNNPVTRRAGFAKIQLV